MSVAAAMANIDPNMEEAARNLGASGLRLFRRITWPLMLPGYFAGAIIVFIWSLTDLGTPLILDYRSLIPVRIFNMLTDINQNPMGYCLVLFMILLTAGFFYLSKVTLGSRGYAMMTRGHVASARPSGRRVRLRPHPPGAGADHVPGRHPPYQRRPHQPLRGGGS